MYIHRLSDIDKIIDMQQKFYEKYRIVPFNVSNWTVSSEFRKVMENNFEYSSVDSFIEYIYSYSMTRELREQIMLKLGVSPSVIDSKTAIFFPNNTLSIVNTCNLLQKINIKKVGIIFPAYFSISSCLESFHIATQPFYIQRLNDSNYVLPWDALHNSNIDALWITSPIYSTGVCYSIDELNKIEYLLKQGITIIADESFCVLGSELVRSFSKYKNFIAIYSPHKALSFNSFKFSVIICDNIYEDAFEQWLDVFSGNLPQSTISAINHFLSKNYLVCQNTFDQFMQYALSQVTAIINRHETVSIDSSIHGNMMNLYLNNINYDDSKNLALIEDAIKATHAFFYPGYLNGFSEDMGFCFRINLALMSADFCASLHRLLTYLSKL